MTDIRVREQIQIAEAVKLKEARKEQKEQMKKVDLYNDREVGDDPPLAYLILCILSLALHRSYVSTAGLYARYLF